MSSSPDPSAFSLTELGPRRGGRRVGDGDFQLPALIGARPGGTKGFPRNAAEEAYSVGLVDGRREGEASALDRLDPAILTIESVAEFLKTAHAQFARDRGRDLQALALAVARRLVQRELAADPAILNELIARALELMPAEPAFEVRLHPEDLAVVAGHLSTLEAGSGRVIQWIAEPTLARGDFRVETPLRLLDGRTDVALHQLYQRLENE